VLPSVSKHLPRLQTGGGGRAGARTNLNPHKEKGIIYPSLPLRYKGQEYVLVQAPGESESGLWLGWTFPGRISAGSHHSCPLQPAPHPIPSAFHPLQVHQSQVGFIAGAAARLASWRSSKAWDEGPWSFLGVLTGWPGHLRVPPNPTYPPRGEPAGLYTPGS
jgi:hypothetical protein